MKAQASADPRIMWNSSEAGSNPPQLVIDATTTITRRELVNTLFDRLTEPVAVEGTTLNSYPNPFKQTNTIVFTLEQSGHAYLSVYDLTGKEVTILVNGNLLAGAHRASFEPGRLPAGIYLLKLVHNGKILTKKLVKE